ncbi:hypothetical protein EDB87DRAFT_1577268 [Lactarius vividus]|nr:hypothetical protein EDB87DRAFT_1577268 [Lactarius vividus]
MGAKRLSFDPASVAEGRAWLAQFQDTRYILLNQYFGREEMVAQGSDGGLLSDGILVGLKSAAREAVTHVMGNPDVQNLGELTFWGPQGTESMGEGRGGMKVFHFSSEIYRRCLDGSLPAQAVLHAPDP